MTQRSYHQHCGLAYALDIIGERWTLLIVRELIAGPRRFKDLLEGLPGISTNLLTERLKSLEQQGLLLRRVLPAPAGSAVYELTGRGRALEPALLELGRWGSQFVPPAAGEAGLLRPGSYALTPKTFFRPEQARGVEQTYALHIDDEVLEARVSGGALAVRQGQSRDPDARFHTDVGTYLALLLGQIAPAQALAQGLVRVEGDPRALEQFVRMCGLPPAEQ